MSLSFSELPTWAIPAAVAAAALLCLAVALALRWRRGRAGRAPRGGISMECTVCQKPLVVHRREMVLLSAPEIALVVGCRPDIAGHKLAEYMCPFCESAHCFVVDGRTPVWIGENLYRPHVKTNRCMECGVVLRILPGPAASLFDDRAGLVADMGMVCRRCSAVACASCVQKVTRLSSPGGEPTCPRCRRRPVERLRRG